MMFISNASHVLWFSHAPSFLFPCARLRAISPSASRNVHVNSSDQGLKNKDETMVTYSFDWLCKEIINKAQDAIVFSDKQGIIRLWNKGAAKIFGHSPEKAIGKTLDIIIPDAFRERHWEGYREVMDTGKTKYANRLLTVPSIRKDGSNVSIEFTIVLVRDQNAEVLGTAAIIRDVSERWKKEKKMKRRLAELEQTLEKK